MVNPKTDEYEVSKQDEADYIDERNWEEETFYGYPLEDPMVTEW